MKRILLFTALIAGLAVATPVGWHLPWNLAEIIGAEITGDSLLADTSFFKHDRASDSSYSLYWTLGISDSVNTSVVKGRVAKVTVRDTLLVQKPYFKVVHAESILPTKGYVDKSDTTFFAHGDATDSTANIYFAYAIGDSATVAVLSGRVGKVTVVDTLLASKPYYKVVHAESILPTKGYVDKTDTTFFTHNDVNDSLANIYFAYGLGDSAILRVIRGAAARVTVGDTIVLKATGSYLGVVNADSMVMSKKYIDEADTASFKHDQESDSTTVLYARSIRADSLFINNVAMDTWGLKGGTYIALTWTADTGTISADTASFHTWLNGIYQPMMSDTADVVRSEAGDSARAAAKDTAVVLRGAAGDSARAAAKDTAVALRGAAGDSARAAAKDTAVVLRGAAGDSARAAAKDTSTALRGDFSDTARIAAHDTADAVRGEIVDSVGSLISDTATVLRGAAGDSARAAAKDTAVVLRGAAGDSARAAAADTAVALRADISDTAEVVRGAIRDTATAIDSLFPTVLKSTRVRGGSYFFSGAGLVEVDSSSIAADSSIFYLWINTKRYALLLSNP